MESTLEIPVLILVKSIILLTKFEVVHKTKIVTEMLIFLGGWTINTNIEVTKNMWTSGNKKHVQSFVAEVPWNSQFWLNMLEYSNVNINVTDSRTKIWVFN